MSQNIFLRLCDYIFVLRPLILIPAWSFYIIGMAQGVRADREYPPLETSPYVVLSLTAILITAYLLNQIFDRRSDELNDKCFYISQGIFRVRTMVIMAVAFFLLASLAYQRAPSAQKLFLFAALLLSLTYSLPPIRLCARPFLDMAANAVGYGGIAFVLGFGGADSSLREAMNFALPYILLVGATFLHTAILDLKGDKAAEKISTAVLIGPRASTILAAVLHAIAIVTAFATRNYLALIITGVLAPFNAYAVARSSRQSSEFLIQANTLIVTLAAIAVWPWYGLIVLPLLLLSRFYHRRRFGITYPGPQRGA